MDPAIHHSLVRRVEVFDSQEQANAAGELLPDRRNLVFAIGAGQEDARLGSGGLTTTQRFGRPSLVSDGVSSISSNLSTSMKNRIAGS